MERLLIERARQRLTMHELAQRSGVNEHTISEIERGVRKPRAGTLAKLADALGIDVGALIEEELSPKAVAALLAR